MNAAQKLLSSGFGHAAVTADGDISAFDPVDLDWVKATADADGREYRVARVTPGVTAAWTAGNFSRPIDIKDDVVFFAGEGIAAAISAGRDEAISKALCHVHSAGRA